MEEMDADFIKDVDINGVTNFDVKPTGKPVGFPHQYCKNLADTVEQVFRLF